MKVIVSLVSIFLLIAFLALFGGILIFFLWPVAVPGAFPGLVQQGTLAAKLSFSQSVALSYLSATLFKSVAKISKKD
jgi:hypothetical protein